MAAKGSGGRASSPFPTGKNLPVNIPGLPQPNMGTTQDFINMAIPAGNVPGVQANQNQTLSDALRGKK